MRCIQQSSHGGNPKIFEYAKLPITAESEVKNKRRRTCLYTKSYTHVLKFLWTIKSNNPTINTMWDIRVIVVTKEVM